MLLGESRGPDNLERSCDPPRLRQTITIHRLSAAYPDIDRALRDPSYSGFVNETQIVQFIGCE